MQDALYDAVAFGMRYWFLLLIALMLFTLIAVSVKEYRRHKRIMDNVGSFVGYIEIVSGADEALGMRIGLTSKTVIGSGKHSDIVIEDEGVNRTHAVIDADGETVIITPVGGAAYKINGRFANKPHRIFTGDVLTFGTVEAAVYFKEEDEDDA